jgi:MYXO-CTERM domain-containing protein
MAQGRTSHRGQRRWDRRLAAPSPATLVLATIAAADWGARLSGDTVFPGGPLDELAHLLTTLVVLWALGAHARKRFLVPALIASVAIDADHIPGRLGAEWLTAGTQRPHTHSVLMLALVVAVAVLWRRRRDVVIGVAIGLAIHFWRDMGEGGGGVSLLWPISHHSFQYPHGLYVAAMAMIVLIDAMSCAMGKWSINRGHAQRCIQSSS